MTLDFLNFTAFIVVLISIILFILIIYYVLKMNTVNKPLRYEAEKFYLDVTCDPPKKVLFPSLENNPSLSLSVIIPAYNEESRLPGMLNECLDYLETRAENRNNFTYEVLIVDDGSSDDTTKIALGYSKRYGCEKCRVLTLIKNRGKGGAVKLGMLSARGENLLFADADGATKFCDIEKLERELLSITENQDIVVVGSRAHLEQQAIASRSLFRTILMYGFHFLVWLFGVRTVRDTQCGFKLFTRDAAKRIFSVLHVERWAFDVELLYIAENLKMIIKEVAVNWTEIEGSKLVPFWSWLQMGIDLVLIWLKYQTGIWKIHDLKKCN